MEDDEEASWPGAWSPAKGRSMGATMNGLDESIIPSFLAQDSDKVQEDRAQREPSATSSSSAGFHDAIEEDTAEQGQQDGDVRFGMPVNAEEDLLVHGLSSMSIVHTDDQKTAEPPKREDRSSVVTSVATKNTQSVLGTPPPPARIPLPLVEAAILRTPTAQISAPTYAVADVLQAESQPSKSSAVAIFVQSACYGHRYIRNKNVAGIVERPERLRAVYTGCAAAKVKAEKESNLEMTVHHSHRRTSLIDHVVQAVHGSEWPPKLKNLCENALTAIEHGNSEIPVELSQGDLYLSPTSLDAIEGSLGTTAEAIDSLVHGTHERVFAAIRPPGHHCGQANPMGFCFVNNAIYGAEYAYQTYGIDRTIILDIDLHHGNGTQALALRMNDETWQRGGDGSKGRKIFYGSLHDIRSYPCELGDVELVKDASMQVMAHGQAIFNVHLDHYTDDEDFARIYHSEYSLLLRRARKFVQDTGATPEKTLVIVSAGFDASEHEYPSMQRHGYKVPTSFYPLFTRDVVDFAQEFAQGRVLSLLEGGYSDRALISGSMGHLLGLIDLDQSLLLRTSQWLSEEMLSNLEKIARKRKARPGNGKDPWLNEVIGLVEMMDSGSSYSSSITDTPSVLASAMGKMTLRDRKKSLVSGTAFSTTRSTDSTPSKTTAPKRRTKSSQQGTPTPARYQIDATDAPIPPLPQHPHSHLREAVWHDDIDPSKVPLPDSPAHVPAQDSTTEGALEAVPDAKVIISAK